MRFGIERPTWHERAPANWQIRRLKSAAALVNDRTESTSLPYVGLEQVESWTGRLTGWPSDEEHSGTTSRFKAGDVLFGKLRPYLAKGLYASFSGRCSPELLVLRPRVHESRFLRYFLLSDEFIRGVNATTYGAKMPRANWDTIGNLLTPVPSPVEQEAIADFLDDKTAVIDELIAKKERLIELIEAKRQATITRAVTKGLGPGAPMKDSGVEWLGEVPEHWQVLNLRRVLRSSTYGLSDSLEPEGEIPVLRMGNISYGRVMMDGLKFVDKVDPHFLLTAGDLLFNRTNSRELVGRVAMFRGEDSEPVSFASYLVRLRTNGRAVPEYLNYLLNTPSILDVARATAIPSIGQANLNPSRYGELLICVPPPGEQMQIVASLVVHERALEKLINPLRRQIASLAEYRQALISAAVTGQLDIRAHESAELPA